MKYFISFIIKFIVITAVLWIFLSWIFQIDFGNMLLISIPITIISFITDMFILPKTGNVVASILDFIVVLALVWILGAILFEENVSEPSVALVSSLAITICEVFYHRYLRNSVFENVDDKYSVEPTRYLQTELAEEFDPEINRWKNKDNPNKKS